MKKLKEERLKALETLAGMRSALTSKGNTLSGAACFEASLEMDGVVYQKIMVLEGVDVAFTVTVEKNGALVSAATREAFCGLKYFLDYVDGEGFGIPMPRELAIEYAVGITRTEADALWVLKEQTDMWSRAAA